MLEVSQLNQSKRTFEETEGRGCRKFGTRFKRNEKSKNYSKT